jgi:hypothetical protein
VNAHLGQPTETQLRRAEAATWGARLDANPARAVERSRMRLVSWKPITKGSLCGCATVELSIGLKLIDCAVFIGTNGAWAAALAKPQLDKEGRQRIGVDWKPSYSPVVEWRSCDLNDRYSAAVVAMVRAAHPEAVSGDFASRPARSTLHSATRHAAGRFHHGARAGTKISTHRTRSSRRDDRPRHPRAMVDALARRHSCRCHGRALWCCRARYRHPATCQRL